MKPKCRYCGDRDAKRGSDYCEPCQWKRPLGSNPPKLKKPARRIVVFVGDD